MLAALLPSLVLACSFLEPEPPPSVLLVTLDTTRADHMGAYGYTEGYTPTFDTLAAKGALFLRAYTHCPLTIPSHSTILTGLLPPEHGVRDNGDFNLGPDAVTLAEQFGEAGYATAAFTAAFPTQARWGFDQGFDIYHDPLERLPSQLDWRDQRTATEVVDDALATLATVEGDPLFVWLHFFDPHWPYDPPPEYLDVVGEGPHTGYDGEIAYADSELGRFLSWWDTAHPRSVVAVTADHGEGLGDAGELTHGFLLGDGTIRVPLVIRGPGIEPGSMHRDPVGLADLAPTLLSLADLEPQQAVDGRNLFDGGSPVVYSESLAGQYQLGLAPLRAITDPSGRYVEGAYGGWYGIQGDSVADRVSMNRDLTAHASRLTAFQDSLSNTAAPRTTLAPEDIQQLMALGYMGNDPNAEAGDIDPRDVIDIIPLTWKARRAISQGAFAHAEKLLARLQERMPGTYGVDMLAALAARRQGNLHEARTRFVDLFVRSPSSTIATQIAEIAALENQWTEAVEWYEEALDLQPQSPEAMAGLIRSHLSLGDHDTASVLATRYLDIYPDHAHLRLARAEIAIIQDRLDDATYDATEALRQLPGSPQALLVMAHLLWERGEADEAIDLLEDAVRFDPYRIETRVRFARCLLEVGRNLEALRAMEPLHHLHPDHPGIQHLYGRARQALDEEQARSRSRPRQRRPQ